MNTHDIELPPLPQGEYRLSPDSRAPTLYDEEAMEAYARSAIEADRKRGGEPVGYASKQALDYNLKYEAPADIFPSRERLVEEFPDAIPIPLFTAPQPAEPGGYVHTAPDDCETLHWRGQILSLNELATISAEPVKVPSDELIDAEGKRSLP